MPRSISTAVFVHVEMARWLIGLDPGWKWDPKSMDLLKTWSEPRDVWIRLVIANCG